MHEVNRLGLGNAKKIMALLEFRGRHPAQPNETDAALLKLFLQSQPQIATLVYRQQLLAILILGKALTDEEQLSYATAEKQALFTRHPRASC